MKPSMSCVLDGDTKRIVAICFELWHVEKAFLDIGVEAAICVKFPRSQLVVSVQEAHQFFEEAA